MNDEANYWSVGRVATHFGLARATVLRMIEDGELPALTIRKTQNRTTYRVSKKAVADFEANRSSSAVVTASDVAEVVAS